MAMACWKIPINLYDANMSIVSYYLGFDIVHVNISLNGQMGMIMYGNDVSICQLDFDIHHLV